MFNLNVFHDVFLCYNACSYNAITIIPLGISVHCSTESHPAIRSLENTALPSSLPWMVRWCLGVSWNMICGKYGAW